MTGQDAVHPNGRQERRRWICAPDRILIPQVHDVRRDTTRPPQQHTGLSRWYDQQGPILSWSHGLIVAVEESLSGRGFHTSRRHCASWHIRCQSEQHTMWLSLNLWTWFWDEEFRLRMANIQNQSWMPLRAQVSATIKVFGVKGAHCDSSNKLWLWRMGGLCLAKLLFSRRSMLLSTFLILNSVKSMFFYMHYFDEQAIHVAGGLLSGGPASGQEQRGEDCVCCHSISFWEECLDFKHQEGDTICSKPQQVKDGVTVDKSSQLSCGCLSAHL